MTLEELDVWYGRVNRANITIISGLKMLKISSPEEKAAKISFAAGVIAQHDRILKEILEEKKNEAVSNNNTADVPM
jgi:hypothetical protein